MPRGRTLVCAVVVTMAAAGAAFGGCKSDEDPTAAFIGRYCDVYKPCCMAAGLPADGTACRALFASSLSAQVKYDATAGDSCIAGLQQLSSQPGFCEGDIVPPSTCTQALGGDAGGGCLQDSDCPPSDQGEVHCISGAMNGKALHQCQIQTHGQLGSTPCVGSVRGGVTLYSGTSDGSIPAQGVLCDAADGLRCDGTACVALAATGEVCSSISDECVDGDFCDVTTGACAARKPIGAACIDQALECQDGAYCDAAGGMTCVAQLDIGAACTDNGQCTTGNCADTGTCAATPTAGANPLCGGG
jgi:hypothetical protein